MASKTNLLVRYSKGVPADISSTVLELEQELLISGNNEDFVQADLERSGINLDGKKFGVSAFPTLIRESSLDAAKIYAENLYRILERILETFISDVNQGKKSNLVNFFSPYERYHELIAAEERKSPQISLMRLDAIEIEEDRWRFLETNTHCPGGVINSAYIRSAWLSGSPGKVFRRNIKIVESRIDSLDTFVLHLLTKARELSQLHSPNIVLATYRGSYPNELEMIRERFQTLIDNKALCGGRISICDIRELESGSNNIICLNGKRVDLIYNKLDPLMIDPSDTAINGWITAAKSDRVEFLNGLGASYISETKRIFALLSDERWREELGFSEVETSLALETIPKTFVLEKNQDLPVEINRKNWVLKPDALTRGAGVVIGNMESDESWERKLQKAWDGEHVIQEYVLAPTKPSFGSDGISESEFYGVDLFLLDGEFSGAVSRCHSDPILNIGSGGKISPVLVVRSDDN